MSHFWGLFDLSRVLRAPGTQHLTTPGSCHQKVSCEADTRTSCRNQAQKERSSTKQASARVQGRHYRERRLSERLYDSGSRFSVPDVNGSDRFALFFFSLASCSSLFFGSSSEFPRCLATYPFFFVPRDVGVWGDDLTSCPPPLSGSGLCPK